jgi:hypothetical protein
MFVENVLMFQHRSFFRNSSRNFEQFPQRLIGANKAVVKGLAVYPQIHRHLLLLLDLYIKFLDRSFRIASCVCGLA